MKGAGNSDFQLELLEYGFLAEDTDPCATTMKVIIPKLQGMSTGSSNKTSSKVNDSAFANSSDSKLQSSNSSSEQGYITARVAMELAHRHKFHDCPGNCPNATHDAVVCHIGSSHLVPCPHFHHDHHFPHLGEKGLIPANSKVIVCFMNHDVNEALVTRLICDFPNGGKHPDRPDEHR